MKILLLVFGIFALLIQLASAQFGGGMGRGMGPGMGQGMGRGMGRGMGPSQEYPRGNGMMYGGPMGGRGQANIGYI